MVQLNTSGRSGYQDIKGGRVPPGRYHVRIIETEEGTERITIKFTVLAGTVSNQENREVSERFQIKERTMPRLDRLAMVLGLIQPGTIAEVHFAQAIGQELIIELEEGREYHRKVDNEPQFNEDGTPQMVTPIQMSWAGCWPIDDPEVADVPRGASAAQAMQQTQQTQQMATGQPPHQAQQLVQQQQQPQQAAQGQQVQANKWQGAL